MKNIILFRHGKSSWDMQVADMARDLEKSGVERTKKSAKALSEYLNFKPDAWFSSPATRARKTAEISAQFFNNPPIEFDDKLYTFSFFDLLKFIKNLDNSFQSPIFFGHNEAFTEFVNRMGHKYLENLPTSGVAVLSFDINNWTDISKGTTQLILKPKEL